MKIGKQEVKSSDFVLGSKKYINAKRGDLQFALAFFFL